jgi:integrase
MPWPKNCLRHSFASYHLAMHESADKTALQMGHRSTTMLFEHYRELVTRSDAERFWGILPL